MAVNLSVPVASELKPVAGLELGYTCANIKKENRKDLLVMRLCDSATVAGVFTKNRFCAAPVRICQSNLENVRKTGKKIRALMVNTGNANAGTGEAGYRDALRTSAALAKLMGCDTEQVLSFSTGVILEPLPVDRILAGLPAAVKDLKADNWFNAAEAIMTTDTIPKAASRVVEIGGKTVWVAVASGMKNAKVLMDEVRAGTSKYAFIEIMGCPGGCVAGGGQPYVKPCFLPNEDIDILDTYKEKRANALYSEDERQVIRQSHNNPQIKQLYADYLGKPLSHKAHELLHTTYSAKKRFK